MELTLDNVNRACLDIAQETQSHVKNLTIHYIVHREGQRLEALSAAAQDIMDHPAAHTATLFLQKPGRSEMSRILGTAVTRQNIFMGLTTKDDFLALCTLNIDHFQSLLQAELHAYHLAWHCLNIAEYYKKNTRDTFISTETVFRDRNTQEAAAANLQADIFAVTMCSFKKESDSVKTMAQMRGGAAIERLPHHNPEHYPFPIAFDTVLSLFSKKKFDSVPKRQHIKTALSLARQIAIAYDTNTIINWVRFCRPAQDMAWRNTDKSRIIGAALHTSNHTQIRAIAYILEEILDITPAPVQKLLDSYSPFADPDINESLHNKMIDTIFHDVIALGISQNSAVPLLKKANEQNMELTLGRTIGWCASALQAAARSFDSARKNGANLQESAQKSFARQREKTGWQDIEKIGQKVILQQRGGKTVTLSDIAKLSEGSKSLEALHDAVQKTITDPGYQYKLAAAAELENTQGLRPVGPAPHAPRIAAPQTASYDAALSFPTLGGAKIKHAIPPKQAATAPPRNDTTPDTKSGTTTESVTD